MGLDGWFPGGLKYRAGVNSLWRFAFGNVSLWSNNWINVKWPIPLSIALHNLNYVLQLRSCSFSRWSGWGNLWSIWYNDKLEHLVTLKKITQNCIGEWIKCVNYICQMLKFIKKITLHQSQERTRRFSVKNSLSEILSWTFDFELYFEAWLRLLIRGC